MGKPRNTQKYPTYPEIPEIPGNTRKKKRYPEIPDRIFRHSYPTRTRPATRYFVQYPTRPDPILKNPTRWALDSREGRRNVKWGPDPASEAVERRRHRSLFQFLSDIKITELPYPFSVSSHLSSKI